MNLTGVFTPVPTPFDAGGALDTDRLRTAFVRWVASPLAGFVVLGSTGEAVLVDEVEADRIVAAARDAVPADRGFIVGTGRESTRASVRAARRAAELGADAVLVRTPGFFKPQMTAEVFVRHYREVADASPVPVLLYNFAALTGVNLTAAVVAELSTHPNIVGVKESGGDVAQISSFVSGTSSGFSVLAGSAATFYDALTVGASGGILALGSVLPDECVRLFELTQAGRHEEARWLQQALTPIARLLGSTYGIPGVKAALNHLGCDVGPPRLPLLPLDAEASAAVRAALDAFHPAKAVEAGRDR